MLVFMVLFLSWERIKNTCAISVGKMIETASCTCLCFLYVCSNYSVRNDLSNRWFITYMIREWSCDPPLTWPSSNCSSPSTPDREEDCLNIKISQKFVHQRNSPRTPQDSHKIHYNDMSAMCLKAPIIRLFVHQPVQGHIKDTTRWLIVRGIHR